MSPLFRRCLGMGLALLLGGIAAGQEKSVKPGINDSFRDPDVKEFVGRFEVESREVYARRKEIVAACEIRPGIVLADIGAGTGLFTKPFSAAVGKEGRVIAVDIAQKFLDHIKAASKEAGLTNVDTILCKEDSTELPPDSIDMAFICDTYHHFEYPQKTLASLVKALRPGGKVVLIDFVRIEGKSTEWTLNHVRAGQEVFEKEMTDAGLVKVREEKELLKENYFVVFEKPAPHSAVQEPQRGAGRGPGRGLGRGPGGGQGRGRGMGPPPGRGPGPELRADQEVFHFLLENHSKIRRSVKVLDNGVETLTESDDPAVASKIQEHVEAMRQRIEQGRGLRYWDELFAAIFKHYDKITMRVEPTEKGVKVVETSDEPLAVRLIQAHAEVVSLFVKRGFEEAHQNHPAPTVVPAPASSKLEFPIIAGQGGAAPRPDAVDPPRAGAKVVIDATADAKPGDVNKALDRAARLLNLYGVAGLKATDVKITIVLHGEATKSVLRDAAYKTRFEQEQNPNLPLIEKLQKAGVEVLVCGQALNYKGIEDGEVVENVKIASSALSVVIHRQADGYAYVPAP